MNLSSGAAKNDGKADVEEDEWWSAIKCGCKVCKGTGLVERHAVKAARRMKNGAVDTSGLACSACYRQALIDGQLIRRDGSVRKIMKKDTSNMAPIRGSDAAAAAGGTPSRVTRSQSRTAAVVELTPEERTLLSLHRNSQAKAGGAKGEQ